MQHISQILPKVIKHLGMESSLHREVVYVDTMESLGEDRLASMLGQAREAGLMSDNPIWLLKINGQPVCVSAGS